MTQAVSQPVLSVMNAVKMTVTPDRAFEWLERANNRNRAVSQAVVQRYARDMKAGNWRLSHQGIAFDVNGILLDGQHRLWAVVEANVPVEMFVWTNVPADTRQIIDGGRGRTLVDRLQFVDGCGQVNKDSVAVLRVLLGGTRSLPMTADEATAGLQEHGQAIAFAMANLPHMEPQGIATSEVRAIVARAWYCASDLGRLERFCRVLRTSVAVDDGDKTVILLRNFLTKHLGRHRDTRAIRYAKTERALASFLRGQAALSKLYGSADELFPLPTETKGTAA